MESGCQAGGRPHWRQTPVSLLDGNITCSVNIKGPGIYHFRRLVGNNNNNSCKYRHKKIGFQLWTQRKCFFFLNCFLCFILLFLFLLLHLHLCTNPQILLNSWRWLSLIKHIFNIARSNHILPHNAEYKNSPPFNLRHCVISCHVLSEKSVLFSSTF